MKNYTKKGVSMIEILITIATVVILLVVVLPSFSKMRENQTLKSAVEDVTSTIDKAKSNTFSSINSSEYGVHFASNQVVLFTGTVYSANDVNNEVLNITTPATISNISLTSGAVDLYFDRLTGEPNKYGTITISTTSFSKIITISATGSISVN